ncbi:Factor Xa inhibitor BuXI [Spatholobus suberectus]|nr:Factor Xa inhibitor BuXI [Spatholobus suberectus]
MKTINSLLALLLLLLAFIIKLKPVIASGVQDTDGSMLENGGDYFILPSFNEEGGGVTLASIGVTHPLAVVQSASKNSIGLPVSISNTTGTMIIFTDEMVSIKFTNIPNCNNSSTWMLVMDETANMWYVGIGNVADYPDHQIKMGRFQIKEDNLDYKLVFCGDANTSSCEDVGIYVDGDKNRRLALSGAGVAVKFKNADKSHVAYV